MSLDEEVCFRDSRVGGGWGGRGPLVKLKRRESYGSALNFIENSVEWGAFMSFHKIINSCHEVV